MIEATFGTNSGELYCRRVEAQGHARAVVMIVHGLGEHCARYDRLANYLSERGLHVCAFDLPGHGRSPGPRVFVSSFEEYVDVALAYRKQVGQWYPGLPVFLLGHSMGGLISTLVLIREQSRFAGGMLSGPAIVPAIEISSIQQHLIRFFSRFLPRMGAIALDPEGVSRNPAVVAEYVNDPLVHHGKVSARLVSELFDKMAVAREQAAAIELPMLILHGGDDPMTAPEGSQFLNDTISSKDKTLRIYKGLFHEVFSEDQALDIYAEVYQWLDQHLDAE
ncbi:MAG: hydrolase [Gammaproteobacteria bacterium]|nr:MAG: hydrolase [Gammaproteobacteria bacterium]